MWADEIRAIPCDCGTGAACAWRRGEDWRAPGGVYPMCPARLLGSPEAAELAVWHGWADIGPLAGWPDAQPLWVVEGLRLIRHEQRSNPPPHKER